QVKQNQKDYEEKTRQLEEAVKELEEKKSAHKQLLDNSIAEFSASLKSKLDDYIAYLNGQLDAEKKSRDSELEALNYDLSQEDLQLKNLNSYNETRSAKKEDEYKSIVEQKAYELDKLNEVLLANEQVYTDKKNDIEKRYIALKNEQSLSLQKKNKENDEAYRIRKDEFERKENIISSNIDDTKNSIRDLNGIIDDLRKALENLKNDHERSVNDLKEKQDNYRADINSQKEYLKSQIESLEIKSKEDLEKANQEMAELNALQISRKEDYENELKALDVDFEERKKAAEVKNEEDIAHTIELHKNALKDIEIKFNENVDHIHKLYEDKKNDYENERAALDEHLSNAYQEYQEKLKLLAEQRENINKSIEDLGVASLKDEQDYEAAVIKLNELHETQLQEVEVQHEERMKNLTREFEDMKLDEVLLKHQEKLNAVQLEKDNLESQIENQRKQYEIELDQFSNEMAGERKELSLRLKEAEDRYEETRNAAETAQSEADQELERRRSDIREYQDEISARIADIKAQKQENYDNYVSLMNEKADNVRNTLEEKRANAAKSYDDRIEGMRKQYELKSEHYNSLLAEIASKKENFETEQKARYEQELEYTALVQKKLDDQTQRNDTKRQELNLKLENKAQELSNNLSRIEEQYNDVLNKKKQSYDEYLSNINEKCDGLRSEIDSLEETVKNKKDEFEAYAANKKQELIDLKNEKKEYLDNVSKQLEEIENKRIEAEEAHMDRVNETKQQIAYAMSEYDNLLRNSSRYIEEETEGYGDLEEVTVEFRQRIDALEEYYQGIMNELDNEKMSVLNRISEDIENLDENESERNQEYEDSLKRISDSYDSLIAEEKDKQEAISRQSDVINEQNEIEIQEIKDRNSGINGDYELRADELIRHFNEQMENCSEEFRETSAKMKNEFDEMIHRRELLNRQIGNFVKAYDNLDKEIEKGKTNLQKAARKLMNDILSAASKKAKDNSRLESLDIMSKNKTN
ncbi:MAG: hypothetical protein Q4D13_04400, partial [Erysipelotrichaceae bacterium]|nr:hypothetical protein [Erysipelotrichaceae bacterium]